jgi:O-antigen/teichoic acid export membrane protein
MAEPEPSDNLLKRTAGGAGWTISWRATTRALGFLSTLVLARILVPADFGLVALATSFASAVDMFGEIGVREALIRLTHSDRETYDTAFTVSVIRGVTTATLILASAGLFADVIADPRLYPVILAIAATVLLDALENVAVADFGRHLNFHREFQLLIFPRLAQVVVTLSLALTIRNYWALVAGILTSRTLQTIASYVMVPYRPRLSLKAWRNIIGFSVWTWMLWMARMIRDRGVVMVIGGTLNAGALGVYTVGSEIATLPETEFLGPLSRACFAGFSAARRAGLSVSDTYLRIVSSTSILAIPASIGISSIAGPLVYLAFGTKWLGAVPVVQVLALAGALGVLSRIGVSLFNAFGYLGSLFGGTVFASTVQLGALVLLIRHEGLLGAAIAWAIGALIEQSIISTLAFRWFAIRPTALLSRIWRVLLASASMTAFLAWSGLGWTANAPTVAENVWQLLAGTLSGIGVYTATLLGLWLLSGRPHGPEMDALSLAWGIAARLKGFVSRRRALLWTAGSR